MSKRVLKRFSQKSVVAAIAATASVQSYAATDWTALTSGVDLSGETTAVTAIFGTLATFAVVMLGGRKVLAAIGGGR